MAMSSCQRCAAVPSSASRLPPDATYVTTNAQAATDIREWQEGAPMPYRARLIVRSPAKNMSRLTAEPQDDFADDVR